VWLYGAGGLPWLQSWYDVRAATLSAGSLGVGASVTIGGIQVGRVKSIDQRGDGAVLDLAIEKQYGPIPQDSRFGVALRTIVGENYVAIYPGHSHAMLPSGALLGPSQAVENVDVDQILNTLQGGTRRAAQSMVQGVGGGLAGRGQQLNSLLSGAAGTVDALAPVTQVLARDHARVSRLTDELGSLTAAIGTRGGAIGQLASGARVTFASIAARDQDLRAMLDRLPGTLAQVRDTTAVLRSVTSTATPVISSLAAAVYELRPAVRSLLPAAVEGRAVVTELGQAAPALQSTLDRLRRISAPAAHALPQLHGALCQLTPAARYLSPYASEFSSLLQGMGSATNFYDANGHAARLYATVGEDTLKFISPSLAGAMRTLFSTGILGVQDKLAYNPLPAPGGSGEAATLSDAPGFASVTHPYPRITAAC
jgi:virulence factor Mce-like protein